MGKFYFRHEIFVTNFFSNFVTKKTVTKIENFRDKNVSNIKLDFYFRHVIFNKTFVTKIEFKFYFRNFFIQANMIYHKLFLISQIYITIQNCTT